MSEIKEEKNYELYKPLTLSEERIMIETTPDRDELNKKLVMHNIGLVIGEMKKYSSQVDIDDLFQCGMVGLTIASTKFDPNNGTKFSTFAYFYIRKNVYKCYDEHNRNMDGMTNGLVVSFDQPINESEPNSKTSEDVIHTEIVETRAEDQPYDGCIYEDDLNYKQKLIYDMFDSGIINLNEFFVIDEIYFKNRPRVEISNDMGVSLTMVGNYHRNGLNKMNRHLVHKNIKSTMDVVYG